MLMSGLPNPVFKNKKDTVLKNYTENITLTEQVES